MLNHKFLPVLLLLILTQLDAKAVRRKIGTKQIVQELNNWQGKWFPYVPGTHPEMEPLLEEEKTDTCDDGVHNIGLDFDPANSTHNFNYLCINSNSNRFRPDFSKSALFQEQRVPPAFVPPVKCLNETLDYDVELPTFGGFRFASPKFGTYKYLPPQRWLHSLAEGAIVMLYHPCAFSGQVELLKNTLRGCLYRHIITPTLALAPERPLALFAWGKYLKMSVVDEKIVIAFIKDYAKHGPILEPNLTKERNAYEAGRVAEAHLVTDMGDSEICGYKHM